jgi:hypothetical protein
LIGKRKALERSMLLELEIKDKEVRGASELWFGHLRQKSTDFPQGVS